jgi:hypothetical protein
VINLVMLPLSNPALANMEVTDVSCISHCSHVSCSQRHHHYSSVAQNDSEGGCMVCVHEAEGGLTPLMFFLLHTRQSGPSNCQ